MKTLKNLSAIVTCAALIIGLGAVRTTAPGEDQARRSAAKDAANAERPNIIFFIVDDLGWQDTSVAFGERPTEFQKHFRTPNLEHLAENGMRFGNAHACTVCTPTRVSILTGQNAARHRVTNWILRVDQETSGKTQRLEAPPEWRRAGTDAQVTLPKILRRQGYTTIHCGKAHWGAVGTPASDPKNLGFEVNIAGHAAGAPGSHQGMKNFGNAAKPGPPAASPGGEDRKGQTPIAPQASQLASDPPRGKIEPVPAQDKSVWGVPGLEKYHGTEMHLTDALAEEAVAALDRVPHDQPFFLYFAPYAVHTPIEPHERFMADYAGRNYADTDRPIPPVEAQYASMVAGVDAALGRLIAKLEEQGTAERTIIVFTSDNGGLSAHTRGLTPRGSGRDTHCWPLRAGKGSAYEGGTRVPLLVAWAKANPSNPAQQAIRIAAGQMCAAPVMCEDFFTTLAAWAGANHESIERCAQAENAPAPAIDGQDLTSLLGIREGQTPIASKIVHMASDPAQSDSDPGRRLLFHYPHVWGPAGDGYQPHSALLAGNWKVIYFYEPRCWELYDLQADIGESQELSRKEPEKLNELATALIEELRGKDALYPTNRNTGGAEPPAMPEELK